jgi:hypothetical protein
MSRLIWKMAIPLGVFIAGGVLGPIIIAAAGAAIVSGREDHLKYREANALVDAYRSRLKPNKLFLSIIGPDDGDECGYKAEDLFPDRDDGYWEARRLGHYTDYEGYDALHDWSIYSRDQSYIGRIKESIAENVSPYEVAFLKRCIESTMLSSICMKRVERFGGVVERYPTDRRQSDHALGYRDRVICTFVDGVAARKGIPLAPLESRRIRP